MNTLYTQIFFFIILDSSEKQNAKIVTHGMQHSNRLELFMAWVDFKISSVVFVL